MSRLPHSTIHFEAVVQDTKVVKQTIPPYLRFWNYFADMMTRVNRGAELYYDGITAVQRPYQHDRFLINERRQAPPPQVEPGEEAPGGPQWGKYTSYLNGRIVLGPDRDTFFLSISIIVALAVIMGLQYYTVVEQIGSPCATFGVIIFALAAVAFFWTSLTDPGVIPKQYHLPENWWTLPRFRADIRAGHRLRYCSKCRTIRPPRTYHCDHCEICIRYQDMHLFVGGLCVGERNFLPYVSLNVLQVTLSIYLIWVNFFVFLTTYSDGSSLPRFSSHDIVLMAAALFLGFIILMAPQTGLLMLAYRIYLLGKDRTMREEYRDIRGYHIYSPNIPKGFLPNFVSRFKCRDQGTSCFRTNLVQVNPVPGQAQQFPGSSNGFSNSTRNRCQVSPLSGPTLANLLEGSCNAHPKRDYGDLKDSAKAKRNLSQSVPMLYSGELPSLPGDRIRLDKNARPSTALQKKIKRFQEVQEMPKPVVDFQIHHSRSRSSSEGAMPRNPMTREVRNELIQLARATQIRRVLDFILARDRRGLIRMARRVDMGGVLGVQQGIDADNLQLIEIAGQRGRNGRNDVNNLQQANVVARRLPTNAPVGLPQMVAAGFIPNDEGLMARHITPASLDVIRRRHDLTFNLPRLPANLVPPPLVIRPPMLRLPPAQGHLPFREFGRGGRQRIAEPRGSIVYPLSRRDILPRSIAQTRRLATMVPQSPETVRMSSIRALPSVTPPTSSGVSNNNTRISFYSGSNSRRPRSNRYDRLQVQASNAPGLSISSNSRTPSHGVDQENNNLAVILANSQERAEAARTTTVCEIRRNTNPR